jgi:hypothetical protein
MLLNVFSSEANRLIAQENPLLQRMQIFVLGPWLYESLNGLVTLPVHVVALGQVGKMAILLLTVAGRSHLLWRHSVESTGVSQLQSDNQLLIGALPVTWWRAVADEQNIIACKRSLC